MIKDYFYALMEDILVLEGEYTNDPQDKGGPTKFGIAYNYNKDVLKDLGILNPTDIRFLNKEAALEVYFRKYFLPLFRNEDDIMALINTRANGFAFEYLDSSVNMGTSKAVKLLQKTINALLGIYLDVDGKFGPLTSKAFRLFCDAISRTPLDSGTKFYKKTIVEVFQSFRTQEYLKVYKHNSNRRYLNSWIGRYGGKRYGF